MSVLDDMDEVLARVPEHLRKATDPTRKEELLLLVDRLSRQMQKVTREAEQEALDSLLSGSMSLDGLGERIRERVSLIGPLVFGDVADAMVAFNGDVIDSTKRVVGKRLAVDPSRTDDDEKFLDWLTTSQSKFLRSGYGRMGDMIAQWVMDQARAQRWSRSQIGSQIADQLRARSQAYADVVASVVVHRARSWAQLSTFLDAGVANYRFHAVMDGLTCFAEGTPVLMANGMQRRLSRIQRTDMVTSCLGRPRAVVKTTSTWCRRWMRVAVQGTEPLLVTRNHLLLTDLGWVRAEKVRAGDRIAKFVPDRREGQPALWGTDREWMGRIGRMDPRVINVHPHPSPLLAKIGTFVEVVSSEARDGTARIPCYDMEVHEDHGYVAQGLIVHNSEGCMFLHGTEFSVKGAHERLQRAMDSTEEDAIKKALPFLQKGLTDTGEQFLYYKDGERRIRVATYENGAYRAVLSPAELEAAGLPVPPLHPHCRSDILPIL